MRTQQLLKAARLMTFMMILGLFSTVAHAEMSLESKIKPGGGDDNTAKRKETIELEQWMYSNEFWSVGNRIASLVDETIDLENWMVQTPFPVKQPTVNSKIELEPWILNYDRLKSFEEKESERIEDWMLQEENFQTREQKELNVIENWMTDSSFWTI